MSLTRLEPIKGEYYLHASEVYRVEQVSKGTDSVELTKLSDGSLYSTRFDTFYAGFEQVWKTGEVASFLGRSPRSIYRYEQRQQTEKPTRFITHYGRELRFYTKAQVLEMHELISQIHQGRPRKDKRTINNTMPSRSMLLQMFRERYKI